LPCCCRQSSRQALPSSSLRAGAAGVPPSSNHSRQKPITGDQNDRERRNRSPQTQRPNVSERVVEEAEMLPN
ncbi:hypothetical protein, partial [Escherichia coli]|uniref:hypothetical protein n=1 Tax=Escherichia coli TaxID=562 RepID=UPI001BCA4FCB